MNESAEELIKRNIDWINRHISIYLNSGGREGHIMDMSHVGVKRLLPTLLLETFGRKSGKRYILALLYGCYDGEWVIIGSKGGAAEHPDWFLNLQAQKDVLFQVATQAFRGTWRIARGEERAAVWNYMAGLYPPYIGYQEEAGNRTIPVIMLKPHEEVPVFRPG